MGDSMSGFVVAGDSSGAITLVAPDTAGTNTITLQANTGTVALVSDITTAISNLNLNANSIGVGQTWQNVTGSRTSSTTYTNTTGKPIQVNIRCRVVASNASLNPELTLEVDGIGLAKVGVSPNGSAMTVFGTLTAIVPPGSTYRLTGNNGSVDVWAELR